MPVFDKTGPQGKGPLTGRGLGRCGFGLGWHHRLKSKKDLANYQKALEKELEDVKKELEEENAQT